MGWSSHEVSCRPRATNPNARVVAFFSFSGSLYGGAYYDTQSLDNVLKAQCLLASEMNGKPLTEVYEPHCGCGSKTSSATRWSSGSSGSNSSNPRRLSVLGEGGKNEDDEYFDLLPNI